MSKSFTNPQEIQQLIQLVESLDLPKEKKKSAMQNIQQFSTAGKQMHLKRMFKTMGRARVNRQKEAMKHRPFPIPPGPEVLSTGNIPLGVVKGTRTVNALDGDEELPTHFLVAGATGASKSTLTKPMLISMAKAGYQINVFSPKPQEYLDLYPYFKDTANYWVVNDEATPFYENPFESPVVAIEPERWVMQVSSLFFDGMFSMQSHLVSCIRDIQKAEGISAVSFADLEKYLVGMITPKKDGGLGVRLYNKQALERLLIRVRQALTGVIGYKCRTGYSFPQLMQKHNFFLVGGITSIAVRHFFIRIILTKIWMFQRFSQEKRLRIIFIDDAQPLLKSGV